jgi:L,D-transpeptidase catalytic domain
MMRWVAEVLRMSARKRMWVAVLLASFLPSCATAPRYTTRTVARPRTSPVAWPRREVLELAMRAYQCGRSQGEFNQQPLLTVIDYSMPSTSKRLWVIDLASRRVLFNELVAHGANSGDTYASNFSNRVGSRQSSLGLFRTDETYYGRHGLSLRLSGLEPGFNDKARERAIVMHGAPYVSDATVTTFGSLGRSWGCPALPEEANQRVIDRIQGGSAVFAYYPDRAWLQSSRFINCDARVAAR